MGRTVGILRLELEGEGNYSKKKKITQQKQRFHSIQPGKTVKLNQEGFIKGSELKTVGGEEYLEALESLAD